MKTVLRQQLDVTVVGWLPGTGSTAGSFGSLLIAGRLPDGGYGLLGAVGSGFTAAARRNLRTQLDALATPDPPITGPVPKPLALQARWTTPRLVGTVQYREYTGGSLRHPSWQGLRQDKTAEQADPVPDPDYPPTGP
ncbi:ATP dependent DNA ligase [Nocardia sp. IFM 10818]